MKRLIGCVALIGMILPLLFQKVSAKPVIEPFIPIKTSKALKKYPYGLANTRSLILRNKHIETVHFQGDGANSQIGYSFRTGLIKQALWLTLKNKGDQGWAQGKIVFKNPIKAEVYNSVVLWVRSDQVGANFWLTLQDEDWDDHRTPQARTDTITYNPKVENQIVQIAVPYDNFYPVSPLDLKKIKIFGIEFGKHTAGNETSTTLEILSVAFVLQKKPLNSIKTILISCGSISDSTRFAPVRLAALTQ